MKTTLEQIKELEKLLEDTHSEDYDLKHKIRRVITKIKQAERLGGYLDNTSGYVQAKYADFISNQVTLDIQEYIVENEDSLTIGVRTHKDIIIKCNSMYETLKTYEIITTSYTIVVFNRENKTLVGILYEDGEEL